MEEQEEGCKRRRKRRETRGRIKGRKCCCGVHQNLSANGCLYNGYEDLGEAVAKFTSGPLFASAAAALVSGKGSRLGWVGGRRRRRKRRRRKEEDGVEVSGQLVTVNTF